jgi:hypothetical protein
MAADGDITAEHAADAGSGAGLAQWRSNMRRRRSSRREEQDDEENERQEEQYDGRHLSLCADEER